MSSWQKERKLVLDTALRMTDLGLVVGKSGNVSLRLAAQGAGDLVVVREHSDRVA